MRTTLYSIIYNATGIELLLSSFYLNDRILEFDPQTYKLEPHCRVQQTIGHKELFSSFSLNYHSYTGLMDRFSKVGSILYRIAHHITGKYYSVALTGMVVTG